jgi:preprotein translocase subunit SecD
MRRIAFWLFVFGLSGCVSGERHGTLRGDVSALRLVDDRAGPGDDQVRVSSPDNRLPDALWLKRDGAITGEVFVDARMDNDAVTRQPIVRIQLAPSASQQFAQLTRANIGHRIAVVVNGVVIAAPVVITPMLNGTMVVTGLNADQSQTLVMRLMGTKAPAKP